MENKKNENVGMTEKEVNTIEKKVDFMKDFEVDPFQYQRENENSNVAEKESNSTIFDTPVPLVRYSTVGKDGNTYSNYRVGWVDKINGVSVDYILELIPAENRKMLFDVLDAMFVKKIDENGSPVEYKDRLPLQVVKTIITNRVDGSKTTNYSLQLHCIDDRGIAVDMPLRARDASSRVTFNYLINKLKENNVIS